MINFESYRRVAVELQDYIQINGSIKTSITPGKVDLSIKEVQLLDLQIDNVQWMEFQFFKMSRP